MRLCTVLLCALFAIPATTATPQKRDAVVAAIDLNIFQAHADRVRLSNIAHRADVVQAMILTGQVRR